MSETRHGGLVAGGLYAVWPGVVFLCATHMSESLFNLLLVGTLLLTAIACAAESRRIVREVVEQIYLDDCQIGCRTRGWCQGGGLIW